MMAMSFRQAVPVLLALLLASPSLHAQSLGNAGTVEGTVADPSAAAVPQAVVTLRNSVTGYSQSVVSGADGTFRITNLPPNPYQLEIQASGFSQYSQKVEIRNAIPISVKAVLSLAGANTTVQVEASSGAIEVDPSAHVDVDRNLIQKLPFSDPAGGLSQAITFTTGGVAADANGFFHPLGDHAQVSFVIDGQPISDQQNKLMSTQLPTSAIQSMEATTGTPAAEFGDKSSLVAQITTRSGLGSMRLFGNVGANFGSFGSEGGTVGLGFGNEKFGNFFAADGLRSGRFLDTPEFLPIHDIGNNESLFDRVDYQPSSRDVFHLNLFAARNWFQIPNDLDQLSQDQHQRVTTWSIAPGYQHTFSAKTLLTINPYLRKDQVNYYPSGNPFNDTPATQSQQRQLLNWGMKADVATTTGRHNLKYGVDLKQTRLLENFQFGVTDPTFNDPCINPDGSAAGDLNLTAPDQCIAAGFEPNTADNPDLTGAPFSAGLLPFDLSRGGRLFAFHATANINQYAGYLEDSITAGRFNFNVGFRLDRYDGLVSRAGPEPRLGVAYNLKQTGTVLRVAYARTFETPFNENLLLSNATGVGGFAQNVFGATSSAIQPGFRNQFNTGFEQAFGKWLLLDADYFWKYTHNAYDFNTLLNTTITFPIAWHNSKLDGVTGRVSTTNLHGFQAYWTFGHTRARFFPPETGGLVPQGAPLVNGVFRIDHDQAFESNAVFRYQHKNQEWIAFTWRYDSGMVVSGVPDSAAALTILTPAQQTSIGLACGSLVASFHQGLSPADCAGKTVTSKLLTLPQAGTENDDHNPDRVDSRHVFNLAIGSDNLFHSEKRQHFTASLEIANLTNKVALYNFLSTFSGTHFLQPRSFVGHVGFAF